MAIFRLCVLKQGKMNFCLNDLGMPALEGNSIVHSVVRWIPSPYFIFCVKPGFFVGQVYLKHELCLY